MQSIRLVQVIQTILEYFAFFLQNIGGVRVSQ